LVPAADVLATTLDLSVSTGSGPVALLRDAAADERRRVAARQIQQARRLAVFVLLPTGLCLLPAFMLLTVVPLVLDLLADVLRG
jgi:tight adherence protein B